MIPELTEIKAGVGALIINPDGKFLAIRETIQDYYEYLRSPADYVPRIHAQVSGKIPLEIFDFLEEYKEEEH